MKTISFIIPTLNESEYLKTAIQSIRQNAVGEFKNEIIVVDTGSKDDTLETAKSLGAQIISIKSAVVGKYEALNRGARVSTGDVLLFLDADCELPASYDQSIKQALSAKEVVAGAFQFTLDGDEFGLRVVEKVNRLRYYLFSRYYGDQGIFVRRDVFFKTGGFPKRAILEASEFCQMLKREGRIKLINKPMMTSPRRFINGGVYKVLGRDFRIWAYDFIGLPTSQFARGYWNDNKKRARRAYS